MLLNAQHAPGPQVKLLQLHVRMCNQRRQKKENIKRREKRRHHACACKFTLTFFALNCDRVSESQAWVPSPHVCRIEAVKMNVLKELILSWMFKVITPYARPFFFFIFFLSFFFFLHKDKNKNHGFVLQKLLLTLWVPSVLIDATCISN